MPNPTRNKRTIHSFVRRTGRITAAQQAALKNLWPRYGIDNSVEMLDFDAVFSRRAPVVLEIGFGNGESMVEQARLHAELDFVGVEVHLPGVGHCLLQAEKDGVSNLRVMAGDAIEVLQQQIADGTLYRVNLYFPDPWPKKRHHKRRIIQTAFLQQLARKLEPEGEFFIATDWADYARHINEVIAFETCFKTVEKREHAADAPLDRGTTKFERRGRRLGHTIWDWRLRRV